MKAKETYLSRDFRETVALRFPARAKELNTAFDMRLSALLAENAGASKEKQYHLKRQILPGISAYETLQRVMPKEEDPCESTSGKGCRLRPGLSGGGGCTFAVGHSLRFLPLQ